MTKHLFRTTLFAAALALPALASAQTVAPPPVSATPDPDDSKAPDKTVEDTKDVLSQPVKDVGISKNKIPLSLQKAAQYPYSLDGMGSCQAIADEVRVLDAALGQDYTNGGPQNNTSVGKAVGGAVVNSLIPFRGLVREVSGAASADRELAAATQAGFARRGFLRGVHQGRGCTDVM